MPQKYTIASRRYVDRKIVNFNGKNQLISNFDNYIIFAATLMMKRKKLAEIFSFDNIVFAGMTILALTLFVLSVLTFFEIL